jgi:hypothetical protein
MTINQLMPGGWDVQGGDGRGDDSGTAWILVTHHDFFWQGI